MERENLLYVDLTAGDVENEIVLVISSAEESPLYTITAECSQGPFTLICC